MSEGVRSAVLYFARRMEERLQRCDSKKSLPRPTAMECVERIEANLSSVKWHLMDAGRYHDGKSNREEATNAAADVANWLMLLLGIDINDSASVVHKQ